MKTLAVLVCAAAAPAHATLDLQDVFAGCAGRYSAQIEHAWIMGDPAETFEDRRRAFDALLETVTSADGRASALNRRIDTKIAQASLLSIAAFGSDPVRAAAARRMARQHLDRCAALLLEGST